VAEYVDARSKSCVTKQANTLIAAQVLGKDVSHCFKTLHAHSTIHGHIDM
jgi:hypothetical protein